MAILLKKIRLCHRAELPALIKGVKELGIKYGFNAVCYGHAGDGNLHIRIKKEGTDIQSE